MIEKCFSELLHISSVANSLGVGFQQGTSSTEQDQKNLGRDSVSGSDILDSKQHQLKLEKSNILLLGPTGSGKTLLAQTIGDYHLSPPRFLVLL